MLNFLKEAMSPITRSAAKEEKAALSSQKDDTLLSKDASAAEQKLEMKGYKITDNERTRKFGIGANSLEMLKQKAQQKFAHLQFNDLRIYLACDGFEISDEEYFRTLASQTLFIVDEPNAIITTDDDYNFEKIRQHSPLLKVSDIVYEFIEQNPDKFRKMIINLERQQQRKAQNINATRKSLKSEHEEWFAGQEERCETKEEAMAKRAQDRVRGYYYKTKEELTRNALYRQNAKARSIIDAVLEKFRYLLIGCDYFSMIFNRQCDRRHEFLKQIAGRDEQDDNNDSDDELDASNVVPNKRLRQVIKSYTARHQILDEWSVALCSSLGDFHCQGSYSAASMQKCCSQKHTINPYASRENLILFQVWNLDHQIELTRTILPAMLQNIEQLVQNPNRKCQKHRNSNVIDISVLEYFLELFSLKNLRLVHIVCHEKSQRSNKSNGRLVCENCHEYRILQELMQVCKADEVAAY